MSGPDLPRVSDPDDWFGDQSRDAPSEGAETWIVPEAGARTEASGPDGDGGADGASGGLTLRLGTLLALAAALGLVLVVAGLALAGVFSGNGEHRATSRGTAPVTTTGTTPTTTTTTAATRPAGAVLPAPTTSLKPGDQGAQVKRLQRALTRLGYDAGTVDGDYGSSTEAAVKRFQRASALTADGVLGPASLRALGLALAKSNR
jgi:putative peptidoglycan binding protein